MRIQGRYNELNEEQKSQFEEFEASIDHKNVDDPLKPFYYFIYKQVLPPTDYEFEVDHYTPCKNKTFLYSAKYWPR